MRSHHCALKLVRPNAFPAPGSAPRSSPPSASPWKFSTIRCRNTGDAGRDTLGALLASVKEGAKLHYVGATYLTDPIARQAFIDRITMLHRECVQHELDLTPPEQVVDAGSHFTVIPHLYNQNGRELFGRDLVETSSEEIPADSLHHFYAPTPRDSAERILRVTMRTAYLADSARVTVPLVPVAGASVAERDSSWWVLIADSNGGTLETPYGFEQGPSDGWDGSVDSCGRTERVDGRAGSYGIFELHCARLYTLTPGEVTDPVVAPQVSRLVPAYFAVTGAPGASHYDEFHSRCGPEYCLAYVIVYGIDAIGRRVATSGPVMIAGPLPSGSSSTTLSEIQMSLPRALAR